MQLLLEDYLSDRHRVRSEDASQSNICNLSSAIHSQQDVGRLQVQVHHVVGVQEMQPLCNIQSYVGTPACSPTLDAAYFVHRPQPYADKEASWD